MRGRRGWTDLLGYGAGVVAIGITVFAFVYLLGARSFRFDGFPGGEVVGFGGWEREERTETVEGPVTTLVLKNIAGAVDLEAAERDTVQVHYVKQARGRQALADFPVEIERRADTLTIRPLYRPVPGSPFGPVSFDLLIPRTVRRVEIGNVSGSITTRGIPAEAEQILSTVSGHIEVAEGGSLQARSTSGAIRFTSSGERVAVETVSGDIEGRLSSLGGQGSVEIGSVSGGVRLQAFEGLSAQVLLTSTSGGVSCEFPLAGAEMRRSRIEGRIGDGAVPLRVRTVSGSIRLERLGAGR